MRCDDVQQGLVDENLPRPDGFQEHLASCEHCQGFVKGLASARAIRGLVPMASHRVPLASVKRRLQITGALALMMAGIGGGLWIALDPLHPERVAEAQYRPVEEHFEISPLENEALAFEALAALEQETEQDTRRDVRTVDLETFGALAQWAAPLKTSPIRSLQLGKADSALIHTAED